MMHLTICVKTPTKYCHKWIINAVYLCLCAKRRRLQRVKCLQHACNTSVLQKHVGVETGSHAGKASRRSERRPPSAKTIIFPTAGSTFPWNRSTEWGGGKARWGWRKKKPKTSHRCGCISVGSVAALQIWTAASTGRIVHLAANSISSVLHFPSVSSSAAQLCTWTEAAAPNGRNSNSLCRFLVFSFFYKVTGKKCGGGGLGLPP